MISIILSITFLILSGITIYFWYRIEVQAAPASRLIRPLILIPLFAAVSYGLMTMEIGTIQINGTSLYLPRYIDWLLTTPLIIAIISALALGIPVVRMHRLYLVLVFADGAMIVTGIAAALTTGVWSSIWYGISTAFFIWMMVLLFGPIRRNISEEQINIRHLFMRLLILIAVLWPIYPVVWLVAPSGLGILDLETEIALYAILDVFAKGIFGYLILSDQETLKQVEKTMK